MKTKSFILVLAAISTLTTGRAVAAGKVDFAKDIQPILQKSCLECHGPEKQKGKLRLDSKAAALKGGDTGPAIVPGQPDKSDLFRRITLPKDHDEFMPSKGDALTKAQTDLIRAWISEGANWPEGATLVAETEKKVPDIKPTAADLKAIAEIEKATGVDIRPVAMNDGRHTANFRVLGTNITDASIAPLKNIKVLYDLNLAGTSVGDAGLANLAGLPNLTRLHLEHARITDAGLANLKGLANLEYLNLFNTKVTDAGLKHLAGLTNLKNLYVFETKVTDKGIAELKKKLPNVKVEKGVDLQALLKAEEKKEEAKKEEAKKDEKKDVPKADAKKADEKKKADTKKKKKQ
ncbi:MAG: c-type cytochrome domain-containing protein [Verrucomicrobiota bacterium]